MKLFLFACLLGLSGSLLAQSSAPIQVTNPGVNSPGVASSGSASLSQTVVEVPWETVLKAYPQVDTSQLIVQTSDGREIPYQLEHRGQKPVQNLLVQLSLAPKQSVQLTLRTGKPSPVKAKTYCRYVPERFDDFAWENDNVAFRIYGAALNGRSDNAYGTDIWAKRTNELVLDKWYKQDDYHKDHGEGLDYYHVGLTLGAGDIGVFLNDSIQFVHNYRSWEILDNGPLRSTFRVTFDPYMIKGTTVKEVRTVSLDAGAQLSKVQVHVEHTSPKPLPMVAGISLRSEPSPLLQDEKNGVMGYWEPKHGNDGTIGVGCVFPKAPVSMLRKYDHTLARLAAKSSDDLIYYTGGAWDKAGHITSSADWFTYLQQVATQQKQPLRITVLSRKSGN